MTKLLILLFFYPIAVFAGTFEADSLIAKNTLTCSALGAGVVRTNGSGLFSSSEISGDATTSGSNVLTFATVATPGSCTNCSITVNAKGLVTASSNGTAPVTSLTVASANGFAGSSSGGATPALTLSTTVNAPVLAGNGTAIAAATTTGSGSTVVLATSPSLVTPALDTPSALVGTNISGTGSSFTAGNINATSNGTLTTLSALSLPTSQLVGTLGVANGGTGAASFTANQPIIAGSTSTAALTQPSAGSTNQTFTSNGSSAPTWTSFPNNSIYYFGDGSDGAEACSTGFTLTRDVYYSSFTATSGCALKTSAFRIFVNGTCDLSAAPAGAIFNNGTNGTAGGATGTAGSAGTGGPGGDWILGSTAGAGGTGSTTTGSTGGASTGVDMMGGGAAAGGAGGLGAGGAGASGGGTATPSGLGYFRRFETNMTFLNGSGSIVPLKSGAGGPGGGGSGGNSTASGAGGGGGGGGGGGIYLSCAIIARGTNSTAGIFQSKGGNGGNGTTPTCSGGSGACGGSGGGSGGAGGWIYIAFGQLTGSVITGAIDVSSGGGGTGGNSAGTGTNVGGAGGGSGGSGRVDLINILGGTSSETAPGSFSAGSAQSGGSGGAGASGTTQQINL